MSGSVQCQLGHSQRGECRSLLGDGELSPRAQTLELLEVMGVVGALRGAQPAQGSSGALVRDPHRMLECHELLVTEMDRSHTNFEDRSRGDRQNVHRKVQRV